MKSCFFLFTVLVSISLSSGCVNLNSPSARTSVSAIKPGIPEGYLIPEVIPDSIDLLPPPPSAESAAMALDKEVNRKNLALHGTLRWLLATEDANLTFPHVAGTFSCALNTPITEQDTPHLYKLLHRSLTDVGNSTGKAKKKYNRKRPFAVNNEPSCTQNDEKFLMTNGSYPSGHAAIGWAWALILCEISPEQTDAILARGWAFGESREVCNVHWQSDVIEGRVIGAAVVARLHADPTFRADLEAAKVELAIVRANGLRPQRDCAAETTALTK